MAERTILGKPLEGSTTATTASPKGGLGPAARRWARRAAPLLVLSIAIVGLLWPAPVDRGQLPAASQYSDLLISHWPSALFIKEEVARTGSLPLWNPFYGGGRPVAADPLAALFYPPTHLVHLLAVRDYLLAAIALHLLWAGLGVLVLGRLALRLSPSAALVAGLAYLASPRLLGHLGAGHLTMLQTVAWYPWVALTSWAVVRAPGRWVVPFAGCVAMLLLAGHPQLAYYGLLMVGALALWLLFGRWRALGWPAAARSAMGLAAGGCLGALVAAVHLLPMLEFTAHSTRAITVASTDQLAPLPVLGALVGIPIPSSDPHEVLFEPGLAVLGLAGLAVARRARFSRPLLLGPGAATLLALGIASPVYLLLARMLPGFEQFRGPARVWFVALVAIALLAGLGAGELATWARPRLGRRAGLVGPACVLLVGVSLVAAYRPLVRLGDVRTVVEPSAVERAVAGLAEAGRVYGAQRNVRHLSAVALGVELAHGQDPLLVEPYATFLQRAGGFVGPGYQLAVPSFDAPADARPDPRLLGLLDVGTVISETPLADPDLVEIERIGEAHVYRNRAAAGRAYLVAPGPAGDPPSIAALSRLAGTIEEIEQRPDRLALRASSATGGYLVIAEPAFPGWTARLDGQPIALETIDGVLPAARIPPGEHLLEYAYAPESLRLGARLTLAGLAASAGWAALWWTSTRRRRRDRLPPRSAADDGSV